jgi:hypothetical protein
MGMNYVLKTLSAHVVNLNTYSKEVSGSNFGYNVSCYEEEIPCMSNTL